MIPIYYADGFKEMNGEQWYSLCIKGKPAQIVDRVCMDRLMMDVKQTDCDINDAVNVFSNGDLFIVDEILCDVGEHLLRVYIKDWRNIIG